MIKRLLTHSLCIILITCHFPVSYVSAEVDNKIPEVESLEVTPQEANVGDIIEIKAKINDMSGVKSAKLNLETPSGLTRFVYLEFNDSSKLWEGIYQIQSVDEPGEWKSDYMYLSDNVGNFGFIDPSLKFRVNNAGLIDNQIPEVESLEVTPQEVSVGDSVKIKAKINDMSRVKSAKLNLETPSGLTRFVYLEFNDSSKLWEGTYQIQSVDEPGEWKSDYMFISDNIGNFGFIDPSLRFKVNNAGLIDKQIPEVQSLEVTPQEVSVGDSVKIKAKINDMSGVKSAKLNLETPSGLTRFVYLEFNNSSKLWEGIYQIQSMDEPGEWKSDYMYLSDNVGNFGSIDPSLEFVVNNSGEKENKLPEKPVVNEVTDHSIVITGTAEVGSTVKVKNEEEVIGTSEVAADGNFTVTIPKQDAGIELTVTVIDAAGKASEVTVIEVKASEITNALESISVDKKEVTAGDIVKVRLNTTNDENIKYIYLYYTTPGTNTDLNVTMSYNADTNFFEGTIPITASSESGIYNLNGLTAYDTTDNPIDILNTELLENGQFIVSDTSGEDLLESLSVDKKEATVGDIVNVSMKVTDDEAEVKDITLYYNTPETNKSLNVELNYNSETKLFEGSIPIQSHFTPGEYSLYRIGITNMNNNTTSLESNEYGGIFNNGNFTVNDTTGLDIIESITVDKKEATVGDTVNISMKVTEQVGIRYILLWYTSPVTKKTTYVHMYYNSNTDSFEGSIPIQSDVELGSYTVNRLGIYYPSGNIYSLDYTDKLESGYFNVFKEENPPTFKGLSIDKKEVDVGGYVNIHVDAVDDTNLQNAAITYISPQSKTKHSVPLEYDIANKNFSGRFYIDEATETGKWKVDSIEIKDTNQNLAVIKAEELDLRSGEFKVLSPVVPLDSFIVTINQTWSNKVINSDVYIAPGVTLSLSNNVTINGNVYVLGGLRSYGGVSITGTLYANSINFGYYNNPVNGQAIISGSNNIASLIVSNQILNEVPLTLYESPLVSNNGMVNISGATLPFVVMEINGQSVMLRDNGTFRMNDFGIGKSNALQVKVKDLFGYTYSYTYEVAEIYINEITKESQNITGKTQKNSYVKILQSNNVIGYGNADKQGYYEIQVSNLIENSNLTFEVYDSEDQLVTSKEVSVKDTTAPSKPVVNKITDKDTSVAGKVEANSTVFVKVENKVIAHGKANGAGEFNLEIAKQKASTEIIVYSVDEAGNQSEYETVTVLDRTAPEKPTVDQVTDQSETVSGKAEVNSTVFAKVENKVIAQGKTNATGRFNLEITKQKADTNIMVYAVDEVGNQSESEATTVLDKTGPEKPTINEVTDQSGTVSGKAEANSTIYVKVENKVIVEGKADATGNFGLEIAKQKAGTEIMVYAVDEAGNKGESEATKVLDKTAPGKPTVNEVTNHSTSVTGTADQGTTITVKAVEEVIGLAMVDDNGEFTVNIDLQKEKTILEVTANDKAGNMSEVTNVIVINTFIDVADNHRFHEEIRFLTNEEIITGFPDGGFRPNNIVTRAQAAIMIGRALNLDGEQRDSTFKDVGTATKASGYIASAVERGIIKGFPDHTYRPDAPVTRGQMAIFIARAFDLEQESEISFTDVHKESASYVYIKRILADGITMGYPDGTFKPDKQLIRSDFSAFMARAIDDSFKVLGQ
jgi:hypothetical protein